MTRGVFFSEPFLNFPGHRGALGYPLGLYVKLFREEVEEAKGDGRTGDPEIPIPSLRSAARRSSAWMRK